FVRCAAPVRKRLSARSRRRSDRLVRRGGLPRLPPPDFPVGLCRRHEVSLTAPAACAPSARVRRTLSAYPWVSGGGELFSVTGVSVASGRCFLTIGGASCGSRRRPVPLAELCVQLVHQPRPDAPRLRGG